MHHLQRNGILSWFDATMRWLFIRMAQGLNLRTRDPAWLSRVEPTALVRSGIFCVTCRTRILSVRITVQLLDQAVWENDPTNALRCLDRFRRLEVSKPLLCLAEAKVFILSKNYDKAVTSAQQALALSVHSGTTNRLVYQEALNTLARAWQGSA